MPTQPSSWRVRCTAAVTIVLTSSSSATTAVMTRTSRDGAAKNSRLITRLATAMLA